MGSHGMRARTRQRRGLSQAVADAHEAVGLGILRHGEADDLARRLEHELAERGLEVADIGGPWVDRSADD